MVSFSYLTLLGACCISAKWASFETNALFLTADQLVFTTHPESQTKREGSDVTFSCAADGKPVPSSFVWSKNRRKLETSDDGRIRLLEDNSLSIMAVERSDSGEFICEAANGVDKVNSNPATLTVECKRTFAHFILKPNKLSNVPLLLPILDNLCLFIPVIIWWQSMKR